MKQVKHIIVESTGFEFKHTTEHEWEDISSEEYREYVGPNRVIRIEYPQLLAVSSSGHRIATANEQHFIPFGWLALRWKPLAGAPHFVK